MIPEFAQAGLTVLERGWLSSNSIVFAADPSSPTVMVDTGYWSHAAQTLALADRALGGRRLDRIVNTHLHSDHCGGNAALHARYGCAIDVPAGEIAKVDAWDETALTFRWTGQHCPRFPRSGAVSVGDTLRLGAWDWQVIGSPGHDPASVVLHQPELELLISADALWENGFGVVFPEIEGHDAFTEVRETLERIGGLRVRWAIPGHGRAFGDVEAALARAHRRLDGLVADPARHARHAAKVLIKFHLLEHQAEPLAALAHWVETSGCLRDIHAGHFGGQRFEAWWRDLVGELAASGALRLRSDIVENA